MQETGEIELLLKQVPTIQDSLGDRWGWLFRILYWIRGRGLEGRSFEFDSKPRQVRRLLKILQVLNLHPDCKRNVAQVLRSIFQDTSAVELFAQAGLCGQEHFSGELASRVGDLLLPRERQTSELKVFLTEFVRSSQDLEWMEIFDQSILNLILDLFRFEVSESEMNWNHLRQDSEKALWLLSWQIQGIVLSKEMRSRLQARDQPLCNLPGSIEAYMKAPNLACKAQHRLELRSNLAGSRAAIVDLAKELNENGANIALIYKIIRLKDIMRRMDDLLVVFEFETPPSRVLSQFIEILMVDHVKQRSLLFLSNRVFSVMGKRIVERNGETGEHYITRNSDEHREMWWKALGGGMITAGTTLFKVILHYLDLAAGLAGMLLAMNYCVSFLTIYFCKLTLGTKQPSVTAAALSARVGKGLNGFVDEVVHLMRSQFTAILGNVLGVIPMMIFICWVYSLWVGAPLVSEEQALHTLYDFSLMGPTPLFAYLTGVLLWISSVFSGWLDNWYAFHRISPALAENRFLNTVLGRTGAERLSGFLQKHILGIAGNISLGLLLTFGPVFFQLFGFQVEVRHVTLSSGALTAAMMSLPAETLKRPDFYLAVFGVLSMGFLNIVVSFGIALLVSIKVRKVHAPKRALIYLAVLGRLLRKPYLLFWPDPPVSVQEDKRVSGT
ncbi:MAG: hypothetical protein ACXWC9_02445 [Pseudobdellovibrionaceae bacterium]